MSDYDTNLDTLWYLDSLTNDRIAEALEPLGYHPRKTDDFESVLIQVVVNRLRAWDATPEEVNALVSKRMEADLDAVVLTDEERREHEESCRVAWETRVKPAIEAARIRAQEEGERLRCAAPDLLAACRAAAGRCLQCRGTGTIDIREYDAASGCMEFTGRSEPCAACRELRAAVARAEGGGR